MKISYEQRRKLKNLYKLLIAGIFFGPAYVVFSDGFKSIYPYINAFIIGIFIAFIVFFLEFIVFKGNIKKLKFYKLLILRSCTYFATIASTIFLILAFSRVIRYHLNFTGVIQSDEFQNYLINEDFTVALAYTLFIIILANFTFQMNRKLGYGVLWDFFTGKYYRPHEVERIIMFVKISNVRQLIKKNETIKFHSFIKTFIFDITEIILFHKGEIYEYVEDEIVVLWDPKAGIENANCLQTLFEIDSKKEALKNKYNERFHFIPEVRASLHIGKLTVGEIGDIKTQLVYQGDPMNTAYRILHATSEQHPFLCSHELISRFKLQDTYEVQHYGQTLLRGKQKKTDLYAVNKNPLMVQ